MEAFKSLKLILKFIGLQFVYSNSILYRLFGFICWFFVLLFIYPVGKYVITTFDDVTKFSEIMPIFAGMLSAFIKTTYFLYNRHNVKHIFVQIQQNIDKSLLSYNLFACFSKIHTIFSLKSYFLFPKNSQTTKISVTILLLKKMLIIL